MPKLSIEIPTGIYNMLKSTFLDDDESIGGFAVAAIQEYGTWLAGQDRPSSMSELETKRIFFIYNSILTDRVPTIWEIGEYFNLPLGRSRYIVQNLNYRFPIFMQKRKKDVVIAALKNSQVDPHGLHSVKCPKECSEILETAISELQLANKLNAVPSRQYYPYYVVYQMGGVDREKLLAQVEAL